jgi:hypothetical protein
LFVDFALSRNGQAALAAIQQIPIRPDTEERVKPAEQRARWFIERPDGHLHLQGSIKLFREIFGLP